MVTEIYNRLDLGLDMIELTKKRKEEKKESNDEESIRKIRKEGKGQERR